jgi:hypothetical protein
MGLDIVTLLVRSTHFDTKAVSCYLELPKHFFKPTTRLRSRQRNKWQDEVREDGRLGGGKGWKERVYDREEWKKFLITARNRRILHTPMEWNGMEWMDGWMDACMHE